MEFALPTIVAVAALIVAIALFARRRGHVAAPKPATIPEGPISVVLDIDAADPSDERVKRLVEDAAHRALAGKPAGEVVVLSRSGAVLGRLAPHGPVRPPASAPPSPYGRTTAPRAGAPGSMMPSSRPAAIPKFDPSERPAPRRPIAEMYELSDSVRAYLRDPADPVDLVRAILASAGTPATVNGDTIRCGERVVIVIALRNDTLMHDALNQAYMTFRDSRATSGVVIGTSMWDPLEVRRREMLEPGLRHAGPDAIQRMADAAALGADPLAFAAAPAVLRGLEGGDAGARRAG